MNKIVYIEPYCTFNFSFGAFLSKNDPIWDEKGPGGQGLEPPVRRIVKKLNLIRLVRLS